MTDRQAIEKDIQAAELTAPRVTLDDVEGAIADEVYFTAADGVEGAAGLSKQINHDRNPESFGLLTFCVLLMRNGFTVTGESACADPANYDKAIGQRIARQNAMEKIWSLLGYQLKDRLSGGKS